ncbi:Sua5/YciO/YrdC/YwlC family tRNA threonylcarbamoyl adenosine modification protein [Kwoniella shandongensis]|uniref:Threonylcarbamoyl-AMP synthase n=1 Tax=Kwoniella shandongensis TaxID=1734106 RepID=A0A5M6C451_9TREE|nr:Sua5/YciO/YrdC/YwlC family tRNA threonylcarbamoyl adenosine modification protein [Kwoniella shandongensis]KAA5528265.1 Sua5/YciO/YrdC/YwlC family tRNA threonylcarbamoyl adenosine modification protein [Kwoniella shandongensis]
MSTNTPILRCTDFSSITVTPSSSSSHPLDSPSFSVPPSILTHLETASQHLHLHRTVAVPTETVYGLAASSLDPEAVQAIYRIKNRPSDNPLIIHVSSLDMLRRLLPPSYTLSPLYLALITAFWPGPLSLLFPSPNPPPPPAPQTNAIRMPAHPLALALINHSNLPLSAPSANSSGRPSPTRAEHVFNDLNGADGLGCILDGGDCGVGVESTVVNGLGWKEGGGGEVDILRPGGLGVEEIARIVEQVDGQAGKTAILVHGKIWQRGGPSVSTNPPTSNGHSLAESGKPKAATNLPPSTPGMKYRHYSPRVPVFLLEPSNVFSRPAAISDEAESSAQAVLRQIAQRVPLSKGKSRRRIGLLHFDNSPLRQQISSSINEAGIEIVPVSLGDSAATAAQRLFAGMLTLERVSSSQREHVEGGVDAIMIEGCSDDGLGLAVMERVGKAVGGGGRSGDLANGESKGGIEGGNRFWVDVGHR